MDTLFEHKVVSGPWQIATLQKDDTKIILVSEEHGNEGSCPENKSILDILKDALELENTHLFLEQFLYAESYTKEHMESSPKTNPSMMSQIRSYMTANRNERIHFVDCRTDVVAIFPDNLLFEAIELYCKKNKDNAYKLLYEALIHPLLSLDPHNVWFKGEMRLKGRFLQNYNRLDAETKECINTLWHDKVHLEFYDLNQMHKEKKPVDEILQQYKMVTNAIFDVWCITEMLGYNGSNLILYAGSLHCMRLEEYFRFRFGFRLIKKEFNEDIQACVLLH
jgi:hypothetical protein